MMTVASFVDDNPLEGWFSVSLIWNTMVYFGFLVFFRNLCLNQAETVLRGRTARLRAQNEIDTGE